MVNADVVLAGTSTVVIGPADLNLGEGNETIVYAIGSAADKTLSVVGWFRFGAAPSCFAHPGLAGRCEAPQV